MSTCHTRKSIRIQYSAPVRDCIRRLRVFPPELRGSQQILNLQWHCSPTPVKSHETCDEFGNRVLELHHDCIEHEFRFSMTLTTSRQSHTVAHDIGLPSTGLGAFLLPSALCDLSDEVRHAARRLYSSSANARKDIALSATRICEWAHGALQYTPGATSTVTTAGQALERGAGVCQDYSHLMIAICRALAIPARYVAGYNPAEGLMHAWVEVLCEGLWHAWDPTHNGLASPHCVFVAGGRDFRDVEPLLGTYRGRSYAQLEVHCHTRVINIAHDGEAIHSLQGKKV